MHTTRKIAKNTTLLFISQLFSSLFGFFATMYAARYLGTFNFGILSLALALSMVFTSFTDFGLSSITIRDVARDKNLSRPYINHTVIIRVFLAFLSFGLVLLIVNLINYPLIIREVIYILTFSVVINSFNLIFNSIFQAYEKMEYQAIATIIYSITIFLGFLVIISIGGKVLLFALIYLLASIIILIYSLIVYSLRFALPKINLEANLFKKIIKEALPFAMSGLFSIIYVWADSLLLSLISGNDAVGIYGAAYRLVVFLLIIPMVFNMSIFPVISRFFVNSKNTLQLTIKKYFKFMLLISVPLGVWITYFSSNIILLIFGEQYSASIIALQILIWSTVFVFIYSPFVQLLSASNRQISLTKITALCMVENIVLNLLLIPLFSYIGASIVTVITELTILILVFFVVRILVKDILHEEGFYIIKIIFTTLLTVIFFLFLNNLFLFIKIPLAVFFYLATLYLLKAFSQEDKDLLLKFVFNRSSD